MNKSNKIKDLTIFFYDIMEQISNVKEDHKKKMMIHDMISYFYNEGYDDGYNVAKTLYCEFTIDDE